MDIVEADGRIDAREVFYYNKLKKELSVPDYAQKDVKEKNSLMALAQIKYFDEEQKKYLANIMANMVVVDEDINVNEVEIYDVICDFAGINAPLDIPSRYGDKMSHN